MNKYITLFFFLFFVFNSVVAEEKGVALVTGTVKSATGEPLDYVSIYIRNTRYACFSDEKGNFSLEIPPGKQHVEFSLLGFQNKTVEISATKSANKQAVNVVLEEDTQQLSEVEVRGKSEGRKLQETGLAVNVIETKEIAIQSIQTNELLDRTAGVRIRQDGGLGSRVNYNINGLSGNAIKVFIDGVPADNYGSSFSLNSIPPALIERVEVYKGVVPGYLSEDALGGAINIVLKQQWKKSLTTSYSYGSFNTHQWNASGSYNWKRGLTFEGSVFYNYSDNNYKVWGKDIFFRNHDGTITESNGKKVERFHDAYKSYGSKFNFGFSKVKWADQFMLGAVLSQAYKEVQNGVTMQLVYGNRHNRRQSEVLTLNYHKKNLFTKGLTLKVDASYSFLKRQVIDTIGVRYDWRGAMKYPDGSYVEYISGAEVGKSKTAEINKDHTAMARANLSYRIGRNNTLYANYMLNDFKRNISDEYLPLAMQRLTNTRDLQKNVLAFTYESRWFSERLKAGLFYKHYFQKVTSNEATQSGTDFYVNKNIKKMDNNGYGLTLSYALFPNLYLLGSAERAIRLPNAGEIFGNVADGSLLLSSFDLEPEKSTNVNIGFNWGTYKIGSHSFNLNSSLFYRDTRDMIRQSYTTGNETSSQYKNLENVETKGIDIELNYVYADKVNFRFNLSKFDVLFNTKTNEAGQIYNYYRMQICNEPSFKFNGNLTYFHNDLILRDSRASFYCNVSYVNSFLRSWSNVGSNNLDEVPAQFPVDLGLTYSFPKNKITLSFDAKNILNQQIYDNFGLQKPGRAFYGKITFNIF